MAKDTIQYSDIHDHLLNKGLNFYSNNANGSSMQLRDHKEVLPESYNYEYLYLSIDQGRDDLVRYLLERNFNPNSSKNGDLIFHWAILKRNVVIVNLFLEYQVNLNNTDTTGNSALHIAASTGNQIIVKALLAAGADCTLRNNQQKTPKELAVDNNAILDLMKKSCNIKVVENNPKEHNGGVSCKFITLYPNQGFHELDCRKESLAYVVPLLKNDDGSSTLIDGGSVVLKDAVVAHLCDEIAERSGPYNPILNNWNKVVQCGEVFISYIPMTCTRRAHGSIACRQYSSREKIPLDDINKMLCTVNEDELDSMPYGKPEVATMERAFVLGNVGEFKAPYVYKNNNVYENNKLTTFKNESSQYLLGLAAAVPSVVNVMVNGSLFRISQNSNSSLTDYTNGDKLANDIGAFNSESIGLMVGVGVAAFVGGLVLMGTACRWLQRSRENNRDQNCRGATTTLI